jgi:hypothetical protein
MRHDAVRWYCDMSSHGASTARTMARCGVIYFEWCPGEDSNLQGSLHWYLKPARLPIPPPGQGREYGVWPRKARKSTDGTPQCQREYRENDSSPGHAESARAPSRVSSITSQLHQVNSLTEPRILALRQRRDGLRDGLAERNSTTCYET